MEIKHVETDAEIEACFPVMLQLRPHLIETEFRDRVRKQLGEGFKLVAIVDNGVVQALGGYRIYDMLITGRTLYLDDLIADETTRGTGYASKLFDWLIQLARDEDCKAFTLDSGFHRQIAHRFYFHKGLTITSFHFSMPLE